MPAGIQGRRWPGPPSAAALLVGVLVVVGAWAGGAAAQEEGDGGAPEGMEAGEHEEEQEPITPQLYNEPPMFVTCASEVEVPLYELLQSAVVGCFTDEHSASKRIAHYGLLPSNDGREGKDTWEIKWPPGLDGCSSRTFKYVSLNSFEETRIPCPSKTAVTVRDTRANATVKAFTAFMHTRSATIPGFLAQREGGGLVEQSVKMKFPAAVFRYEGVEPHPDAAKEISVDFRMGGGHYFATRYEALFQPRIMGRKILADAREGKKPTLAVMGCGTGWLGLTLAQLEPELRVLFTDINAAALNTVQQRIAELGIESRTSVREGNLFDAFEADEYEDEDADDDYEEEDEGEGAEGEDSPKEPAKPAVWTDLPEKFDYMYWYPPQDLAEAEGLHERVEAFSDFSGHNFWVPFGEHRVHYFVLFLKEFKKYLKPGGTAFLVCEDMTYEPLLEILGQDPSLELDTWALAGDKLAHHGGLMVIEVELDE